MPKDVTDRSVVQLCLLLLNVHAGICSKAGAGYNAAAAIFNMVLLQKVESSMRLPLRMPALGIFGECSLLRYATAASMLQAVPKSLP